MDYKSVPVEPTQEMIDAAHAIVDHERLWTYARIYRAMLDAAPQPAPDAPKDGLVERLKQNANYLAEAWPPSYDDILAVMENERQAAAALESQAAQIVALQEALQSIAANSCCDRCQEAALVARAALAAKGGA